MYAIRSYYVSTEQLDYARRRLAGAVAGGRCELRLQDYRDVGGTYDRIVSIEMLEKRNLAEAALERGIMEIIYRSKKSEDLLAEVWRLDGTRYRSHIPAGLRRSYNFV